MIRAHLRRLIGGGLGGPLRSLPQGIACAGEARARTGTPIARRCDLQPVTSLPRESVPLSSAGFAGATNPGGRFRKGGEAPLRGERTGSTPRVRPSGAALQLDPSHRSSQSVSPLALTSLALTSSRPEAPGAGAAASRR